MPRGQPFTPEDSRQFAERMRAAGTHPRRVGELRTQSVLLWIYHWGYASPYVVNALAGTAGRSTATRLVRAGLCMETPTASGAVQRFIPNKFLTLTESGIAEVEKNFLDERQLLPRQDPLRVRQSLLRHNEIAQRETLRKLESGRISGYETERQLARFSEPGIKQPDVAWTLSNSTRMGIEIELSPKWERDFDQFVLKIKRAICDEKSFFSFTIFAESPAIIKRYTGGFDVGRRHALWKKSSSGHWERAGDWEVPAMLNERVKFFQITGA